MCIKDFSFLLFLGNFLSWADHGLLFHLLFLFGQAKTFFLEKIIAASCLEKCWTLSWLEEQNIIYFPSSSLTALVGVYHPCRSFGFSRFCCSVSSLGFLASFLFFLVFLGFFFCFFVVFLACVFLFLSGFSRFCSHSSDREHNSHRS